VEVLAIVGAGRQHVNTSDSRVQLTWSVEDSAALGDDLRATLCERLGTGSVTVTVSAQRSQWRNRETALSNLAALLRDALSPAPTPRRPTSPTRGSRRRDAAAKKHRSAIKQQRQRQRPDGN
jgi:ribosome-associated protein